MKRFTSAALCLVATAVTLPAHAGVGEFLDDMFTYREDQKPRIRPNNTMPAQVIVTPTFDEMASRQWSAEYTRGDLVPVAYMDGSSMVMRPNTSGQDPMVVNPHGQAWPGAQMAANQQNYPGYLPGYSPANPIQGHEAMLWRDQMNRNAQARDQKIYIGEPEALRRLPATDGFNVGMQTKIADPVYSWREKGASIASAQPGDYDYTGPVNRGGSSTTMVQQPSPMMEQGREVTRLPDNYTVQKGDSLSTISGQDQIYGNWQLWPLIYDANRTQITKDPDLIYPQQNLGIPRGYSVQEAEQARQRALQKRPPHRLNDGY